MDKPVEKVIEKIAIGLGYDRNWSRSRLMYWETRKSKPFKSLIGTVLSARNRDESTAIATENLFREFDTPKKLAKAPIKKIEKLIRKSGFYKIKARRVKEISQIIIDEHNGKVPESMEELCSLPGVGRKTAGCVLVYAFGKPAIPVDTHVHRASNRIGLVRTNNPDQTEQSLMRLVPKRYWLAFNDLFVAFGKRICKPIGPLCPQCPVNKYCDYYKDVYSPSRGRK